MVVMRKPEWNFSSKHGLFISLRFTSAVISGNDEKLQLAFFKGVLESRNLVQRIKYGNLIN